jgi:hypothetical protein
MENASAFTVRAVDERRGTCLIVRGARSASFPLDGTARDAQYILGDGRALIVLTNDNPYDAIIYFYLLSATNEVVDGIQSGGFFTSGIFVHQNSGDLWLDFLFFKNNKRYRITAEISPSFSLGLLTGWKYRNVLQRHWLTIDERALGSKSDAEFEAAVRQFESAATSFAVRTTKMAEVRTAYGNQIREMSLSLLQALPLASCLRQRARSRKHCRRCGRRFRWRRSDERCSGHLGWARWRCCRRASRRNFGCTAC